jgi:prepilin-type processing-associated H-X9-DG protein
MYAQDYDEKISRCGTLTPRSYWNQYVEPYVKNAQVFVCPSRSTYTCGYAQNSMIAYWGASPPSSSYPGLGKSIGEVAKPAETILLTESRMQLSAHADHCYSTCSGMDRSTDQPAAGNGACIIHNGGSNVGYFDGHVKWVQWDVFLNDQTRWYGN